MTDVRDRQPRVELDTGLDGEIREIEAEVPRRRALTLRSFSPLRRPSARDLMPTTTAFEAPVGEPEPRTRTKFAVVLSLILVVALPVIGSGIYLFAFASDQYVADTRFAVRKATETGVNDGVETGSSGGNMSAGAMMSGTATMAGENAEIIANYIHSRAAVDDVSRSIDVRQVYQRPEADFWARLPAKASAEDLDKYWNRMVSVYVESSSGIVQVSVSAFRREDALALAKAILASSERLANSLSLKMQADQTRLAEDEVRRTEGGVRFALADLTAFRNSQHLINPVESSEATGKLLLQLMSDKIQTEGQLFVTQQTQGANAPGIGVTKARLDSINKHVAELQNQLAGNKDVSRNMAATMSRFEELELKKEFAEKMFDFAREGLERARLNAMGQSIYLAVFVPPSLPQDFSFPERYTDLCLIAIAAVMAWVSGATITASVLDHRL